MQKWMDWLPLFLECEALLVWSGILQSDQLDKDVVQVTLSSAFSVTSAAAYRNFVTRHVRPDEAVEAFVAALRRFAQVTGQGFGDPYKDPMVVEQMVAGLPVAFIKEIKVGLAGQDLTVSAVSERVHALRTCERDSQRGVSAVASNAPLMALSGHEGYQPRDASQRTSNSIACFRCGEVGHVERFCPEGQNHQYVSNQPFQNGRSFVGQFCDHSGHSKRDCPERAQLLKRK